MVRVSYAFYAGDTKLPDSWHDDFRLRAFGLLSRSVAGLAFTRQVGTRPWSPTASISWVASYRRWPKEPGKSSLGSSMRAFGLGFSTMSLNFQNGQRVQIGLGPTVALLDDRILVGYGNNLQADDDPWFWFFSLRLFSATGALGGQ